MGAGNWERSDFEAYSSRTKHGATIDSVTGKLTGAGVSSHQAVYTQEEMHPDLDPLNIVRECVDSEEHPETIPVILALDVTGSMGSAALEVAKSLNAIMTGLYKDIKDVEFCIMGIGDLYCDDSPIQMSQFESDIRIAEHMDKIYFEGGGGGNDYESYTAAWYMGTYHTSLDCWKRNKKGIIITLGDENLNPYLIGRQLMRVTGDSPQSDIDTKKLYKEAKEKFDIFHVHVNHGSSSRYRADEARRTFSRVIGEDSYFETEINSLPDVITKIITDCVKKCAPNVTQTVHQDENGYISW